MWVAQFIDERPRQGMRRATAGGPFAFFAPPLQARMRNMVIETRAHAVEHLALNAKQRLERRTLGGRSKKQGEVPGRL